MSPTEEFEFHLFDPASEVSLAQDEEWFYAEVDGARQRIRFHDYGLIYDVPGLYERLFYELLECKSPETVVGLLRNELEGAGVDPASLDVLDLGAGNGMVGEELREIGVNSVVGVDVLVAAAAAANRDRPGIYEDYVVADITRLSAPDRELLANRRFNCLTTVAALGFDDIPPEAFATAYDLISPGGWIALTIKEDFLTTADPSGFESLIRQLGDQGMLEVKTRKRYRHRLSSSGESLYYVALIATTVDGRRSAELIER